jgi:hypothetical protein
VQSSHNVLKTNVNKIVIESNKLCSGPYNDTQVTLFLKPCEVDSPDLGPQLFIVLLTCSRTHLRSYTPYFAMPFRRESNGVSYGAFVVPISHRAGVHGSKGERAAQGEVGERGWGGLGAESMASPK